MIDNARPSWEDWKPDAVDWNRTFKFSVECTLKRLREAIGTALRSWPASTMKPSNQVLQVPHRLVRGKRVVVHVNMNAVVFYYALYPHLRAFETTKTETCQYFNVWDPTLARSGAFPGIVQTAHGPCSIGIKIVHKAEPNQHGFLIQRVANKLGFYTAAMDTGEIKQVWLLDYDVEPLYVRYHRKRESLFLAFYPCVGPTKS